MLKIDAKLFQIDKVICDNIERFDHSERGLLSQNILAQLRNYVEHIFLKVFSNGRNIEISYDNIVKAISDCKTRGNLKFINRFHRLLQISASHYTLDEENSERLMLKYYEYLLQIKIFLKTNYDLEVLNNIASFPIHDNSSLKEYYSRIADKIIQTRTKKPTKIIKDRFYIKKVKPFFIGDQIFYEITFTRANDYVNKFDRIIAFTKKEITYNYSVRLSVIDENIDILGKSMPIQIIVDWEVSIRPCELNNFADLFGNHHKIGGNKEYYQLMRYLTNTGFNLVDLIDFDNVNFEKVKNEITIDANVSHFFEILRKCREISQNKMPGSNLIRYLLFKLNNKVIKSQISYTPCSLLSNLRFQYGCIPFDVMPFNTSLLYHNPRLSDLFDCLDFSNRLHEIFARLIKINTENKGQLYTPQNEISNFENIDELIKSWNGNLYKYHEHRKIDIYKEHILITGYEKETYQIILELKKLALSGVNNFSNSVKSWIDNSAYSIDCEEKKNTMIQMFENSKVAIFYGAAGTGKSTLINHISNFFYGEKKLYLANTNPAVDNLKRKVTSTNCTFKTISKFKYFGDKDFDVLFIDECSTVSNQDMLEILTSTNFELLILVGDVFQIESILFGNWFNIAKSFLPASAVFELKKPYRSTNSNLLEFWNRVRNLDENILELITKNEYSNTLNETIFEKTDNDEIILCLNYDGLYGINNLNRFLQSSNINPPVEWSSLKYKVNDPIIFFDNNRFAPLIYNNLKGRIDKIVVFENRIQFNIEIDKVINEFDARGYEFQLVDNSSTGNSIISFDVNKYSSTDEGDDDDDGTSDTIVPFQVAYAVSIHKAQGLEYKSVKIVITDEVEEKITHNIFYTSITRARENLKIFWTPETENKVLSNLVKKVYNRDVHLLKTKFDL